jgi:hypothetical protein
MFHSSGGSASINTPRPRHPQDGGAKAGRMPPRRYRARCPFAYGGVSRCPRHHRRAAVAASVPRTTQSVAGGFPARFLHKHRCRNSPLPAGASQTQVAAAGAAEVCTGAGAAAGADAAVAGAGVVGAAVDGLAACAVTVWVAAGAAAAAVTEPHAARLRPAASASAGIAITLLSFIAVPPVQKSLISLCV